MAHSTVLGLDVGSQTIRAVIAEPSLDAMRILSTISRPSRGIRKGIVVDIDDASQAIGEVLQEARLFSRSSLRNVCVSMGAYDSHAQVSRGIVAVSRTNSEVYQDDIDRVIEASQAVHLDQNRMLLHTVVREFTVDGVADIRSPLGMVGSRLEVSSIVVDAFKHHVKDLTKCVEVHGGSVSDLVFAPLASARSVLNKNQRDLGVVLIDLGALTTSIAVYEEDKLLHTAIFPVGASHITNDLAVALKIPVDVAEKVKLTHGFAVSREVPAKETIDLRTVDLSVSGAPLRRFVAEVIESRLQEIFDFVNGGLRSVQKAGRLPAGAVLVGGGAKLAGVAELARQELKLSTQIGLPVLSDLEMSTRELSELVDAPEYATVLGLILWGRDGRLMRPPGDFVRRAVQILKNLLP